jgi:hypothetical protein
MTVYQRIEKLQCPSYSKVIKCNSIINQNRVDGTKHAQNRIPGEKVTDVPALHLATSHKEDKNIRYILSLVSPSHSVQAWTFQVYVLQTRQQCPTQDSNSKKFNKGNKKYILKRLRVFICTPCHQGPFCRIPPSSGQQVNLVQHL